MLGNLLMCTGTNPKLIQIQEIRDFDVNRIKIKQSTNITNQALLFQFYYYQL